jgi:hypothetical protein
MPFYDTQAHFKTSVYTDAESANQRFDGILNQILRIQHKRRNKGIAMKEKDYYLYIDAPAMYCKNSSCRAVRIGNTNKKWR